MSDKLILALEHGQMCDLLTAVETMGQPTVHQADMDLDDIEQAIIDTLYLYDPEAHTL